MTHPAGAPVILSTTPFSHEDDDVLLQKYTPKVTWLEALTNFRRRFWWWTEVLFADSNTP
eukprot:8735550-Karenia_brevis.AAC.1